MGKLRSAVSMRPEVSEVAVLGDIPFTFQTANVSNLFHSFVHHGPCMATPASSSNIEIIIKVPPPLKLSQPGHINQLYIIAGIRRKKHRLTTTLDGLTTLAPCTSSGIYNSSSPRINHRARRKRNLTCSNNPISCSSLTLPRTCPVCAILNKIPSIRLDRSGSTNAILDTDRQSDRKICCDTRKYTLTSFACTSVQYGC